jgi:hypothetical protein
MESNKLAHTLRQSVMHRPMLPSPATSTTFSCQLSKTLIAPVESLPPPGRPLIWLKPVCCGVMLVLVGVRGPLEEDEADPAMPLYLCKSQLEI